jgi:cysteine desulfurase
MVRPVIIGAGQQGGLRGGTMPTELITGFGEACRILQEVGEEERFNLAAIRDHFVKALEQKQIAKLIGSLDQRHPGNALMRFPGHDASDLLARLQPQIAASTQSACSSGSIEPSHVLRAMGFDDQTASECIRFSFGRFSTEQQVNAAIDIMSTALELV